MGCHTIECSRVNKPYIIWSWGVCPTLCRHWMCFVSHREHFSTITVVGFRNVISELSIGWSWLSLLLLEVFLEVVEFSKISALNGIVLSIGSGMIASPSSRHSTSCVRRVLLVIEVVFYGLLLVVSALAESASSSATLSSSSIIISVEDQRRRDGSPSQAWSTWLCQIKVLSRWGIFTPFQHHRWRYWLIQ